MQIFLDFFFFEQRGGQYITTHGRKGERMKFPGGPDLFLAAEMEKGQTKRPGPDLSGA